MFSGKWKDEIFTIPNLLSLFRITLIPVYTAVYLNADSNRQYFLSGGILTLSCMTDMIDGIIARKFDRITNVGKVLDPLADKLTQFTLILCLCVKYSVLYPVLVLFLIKELFQCGALIYFAHQGKVLCGALPAGKVCTAVLFISLIFLVLFPNIHPKIIGLLTITDAVFLLYAFLRYLSAYLGNENCLTDWYRNQ